MNIASICQRDIVTIEADASLRHAATLMREHHVGALVVTDAAAPSRVAGVVTDRDLAISTPAASASDRSCGARRCRSPATAARRWRPKSSASPAPCATRAPASTSPGDVFLPLGMLGMH